MVKGDFSGDSGNCGKPADARVSMGSGVLALAGRMDADTLPKQARYQLRYTRLFRYFIRLVVFSQTRRDTNFAIPGYSISAIIPRRGGKSKIFLSVVIYVVKAAFVALSATGGSPANAGVARLSSVLPCPVPDTTTALPNNISLAVLHVEETGKRLLLMGAAFTLRRERLSKQRHYNRQDAEKQERESGNLLFCEFRLYGGLDFCYNAEKIRKAGTAYANEKKKQSGAAHGGV